FLVQFNPSAEEGVFVEITENEIRIRHRGVFAPHCIEDRPRQSSRSLGPYLEQTRFRIYPGNAATAGANRLDPDFGGENTVAQNNGLIVSLNNPVPHNADLEC